jgi:tetratricopeptide (TPR) repeat protein
VSLIEAQRYAEQLGDQRRLGRVLVSMNSYLAFGDNLARGMDLCRRALAIGEETDDLLLQAAAYQNLGQDYHAAGDYPTAIELLRQGIACMEREAVGRGELLGSGVNLAVYVRCCIAWSLSELGDFTTALEYTRDSVRVADEIGFIGSRMVSRLYIGMVCNRKGDFRESVQPLELAYEFMVMGNLQVITGFNGLTGSLGTAYLRIGRVAEAVDLLERCRAQSHAQGAISDLFIGAPALAEAYLTVGRDEEALAVALEAVGLAREQGKRGFLGWQLHALAEVYSRREPAHLAASETHYREALTIALELRMRPMEARCRLGLGTLHQRAGRLDEAREELTQAVAMLREMGMTHWLPEAESALVVLTR